MEYNQKEILFEQFKSRWEEKLNKIPSILRYISSYPEVANKIKGFYPFTLDEVNNSQLEWISLLAQLDNPIETTFFKEYWVPIQHDGYDYFIDLSSDSLPLFEADFFPIEPYCWCKCYIFKDLSQFLLEIDQPDFNIEQFFQEFKDDKMLNFGNCYQERGE